MLQHKNDIICALEKDMLTFSGGCARPGGAARIGLGPIEAAFPGGCFTTGGIHECISTLPEEAAATNGFTAGLIAKLLQPNSAIAWISTFRKTFPPSLKTYGITPERVLFIDVAKEKDALWTMEEALKCTGFTAVIGEINRIDFTASRRLQLATEQSRVTGFILRNNIRYSTPIACVARWKITPLSSHPDTPGVGFKRWNVELLKVRNGKPGTWEVEWNKKRFRIIEPVKQPVWENATWPYGSAI